MRYSAGVRARGEKNENRFLGSQSPLCLELRPSVKFSSISRHNCEIMPSTFCLINTYLGLYSLFASGTGKGGFDVLAEANAIVHNTSCGSIVYNGAAKRRLYVSELGVPEAETSNSRVLDGGTGGDSESTCRSDSVLTELTLSSDDCQTEKQDGKFDIFTNEAPPEYVKISNCWERRVDIAEIGLGNDTASKDVLQFLPGRETCCSPSAELHLEQNDTSLRILQRILDAETFGDRFRLENGTTPLGNESALREKIDSITPDRERQQEHTANLTAELLNPQRYNSTVIREDRFCFGDREHYNRETCCDEEPFLVPNSLPPNHSREWRVVVDRAGIGGWVVHEIAFYLNRECNWRPQRAGSIESGHQRLHFASNAWDMFSFGFWHSSKTEPSDASAPSSELSEQEQLGGAKDDNLKDDGHSFFKSGQNSQEQSGLSAEHFIGTKTSYYTQIHCFRIEHDNIPGLPLRIELLDPQTRRWTIVRRYPFIPGGMSVSALVFEDYSQDWPEKLITCENDCPKLEDDSWMYGQNFSISDRVYRSKEL